MAAPPWLLQGSKEALKTFRLVRPFFLAQENRTGSPSLVSLQSPANARCSTDVGGFEKPEAPGSPGLNLGERRRETRMFHPEGRVVERELGQEDVKNCFYINIK